MSAGARIWDYWLGVYWRSETRDNMASKILTRSRSSSIRLPISPLEKASRPLLPDEDDSLSLAIPHPCHSPPMILTIKYFQRHTYDLRINKSSCTPAFQYLQSARARQGKGGRKSSLVLLLSNSRLPLSPVLPSGRSLIDSHLSMEDMASRIMVEVGISPEGNPVDRGGLYGYSANPRYQL